MDRKKDTTKYRAILAQLKLGRGWVAASVGAELSNKCGSTVIVGCHTFYTRTIHHLLHSVQLG